MRPGGPGSVVGQGPAGALSAPAGGAMARAGRTSIRGFEYVGAEEALVRVSSRWTSAAMAALLLGLLPGWGMPGAAGDDAVDLEKYRRANVLSEEEIAAVAPEVRQAHVAALADYDEAVASGDPKHPGYARARKAWEPLAAAGDPASSYHLAMLHLFGLGGAAFDQLAAVRLIEGAAEHRYPPAQTFMGLLAERGDGTMVAADEGLALEWYTHGAQGGHCAAVRRVVRAWREGELGVTPDAGKAREWSVRLDGCRKR